MKREVVEDIKRVLRSQIRTIPVMVEDGQDRFRKGNKRVWLSVGKNRITVEPIGYWYASREEAMQWDFGLKGSIENYVKYGIIYPRLCFEERSEKNKRILYCVMEAAGIKIEFRPRWFELLDGVNQMVFTEYKNAKEKDRDSMLVILTSLRKITHRAERYCKLLGYDV